MGRRSFVCGVLLLLAWLSFGPGACGFTHAQLGTPVPNLEMPTLEGGKSHLLDESKINIIFFFRPGQDYSELAMKEMVALQAEMSDKPVRWVAIASDRYAKADVQAAIEQSGLTMPVLIDEGDVLYGTLGVAQLPTTAICDEQHKLAAYQPFMKVNYAAVLRARVRYLLHEITAEQLDAVLNPPAATTDSEEAAALRRLTLANKLFDDKRYDKALENVEASLQRAPTAPGYALRGDILAAEGKCAEAVQSYAEALKIDAKNERATKGREHCAK